MKRVTLLTAAAVLTVIFLAGKVFAGPPFINLEGTGGVAFNPLAYLAEGEGGYKIGNVEVAGKPRFGVWYVNLNHVNVDWTVLGVADTFFKRLEISYGYETVAQSNSPVRHKNNLGTKLLLLPENSFQNKFLPAISVGALFKTTSRALTGLRDSGFDYYLVASKTITQLPVPVVLSAGLLSGSGYVTGVYGFTDKRKETAFGNIDLVLPWDFVAGFEYKQGERFAAFKNANYWDAHIAWFPNKNLSLIAAYVNAGDNKSARATGLGDGFVLSVQYAF